MDATEKSEIMEIVMELEKGPDVWQLLQALGALPQDRRREAARICIQALENTGTGGSGAQEGTKK